MVRVKPSKKKTTKHQVSWWTEWVYSACQKSSVLCQPLCPIKLLCTAPVWKWLQIGCSNEKFWQEALLTQTYCHLNCLLTQHIHQHYPQSTYTSFISKKSTVQEFQKRNNQWAMNMIKGHWMDTLRNQKRLFYTLKGEICTVPVSYLPSLKTASWLNSLGTETNLMLHLSSSEIMSSFCTLQTFGQEKQITISKKGIKCIESWT